MHHVVGNGGDIGVPKKRKKYTNSEINVEVVARKNQIGRPTTAQQHAVQDFIVSFGVRVSHILSCVFYFFFGRLVPCCLARGGFFELQYVAKHPFRQRKTTIDESAASFT